METRAQELIEEALTLRELRHAQHLTQKRMAALLGVEQEHVSRIERRAVAYLGAADKVSGPLLIRLSEANQPVIRTRNQFASPCPRLSVCI